MNDGYVLVPTCPQCRRILLDNEGICPGCGHEMTGAEEWIQPVKLEPSCLSGGRGHADHYH